MFNIIWFWKIPYLLNKIANITQIIIYFFFTILMIFN